MSPLNAHPLKGIEMKGEAIVLEYSTAWFWIYCAGTASAGYYIPRSTLPITALCFKLAASRYWAASL